jgi:hypothetical protein
MAHTFQVGIAEAQRARAMSGPPSPTGAPPPAAEGRPGDNAPFSHAHGVDHPQRYAVSVVTARQ